MKYVILEKNNIDVFKKGNYTQKQLNNYESLGYSYEIMPNDFPDNLKWEIKKDGNKYVKKTQKEIDDYKKEKGWE